MNDSHPQTSYLLGLSRKDFYFTILIIAFFIICFYFIFKAGFILKLEPNTNVVKFVILGFQIALLSALTLTCFYAYQLTKNTSFYYIAYCWAAHAVYKIFTIIPAPEDSQVLLTGIVALVADLPLFLSSFPDKQRKLWLPIFPILVFLFTVFINNDVFIILNNLTKKELIYLIGPLQSIAILILLTYSTVIKNIFVISKKLSLFLAGTFFVLAISQIPFIYYESLCPYNNPENLAFCMPSEISGILWKLITLGIFSSFLAIVFFTVKDKLSGIREEKELAKEQLKVKNEFAILGYLTASIEHELRNPLQAVISNVNKLNKLIEHNKELTEKFGKKFEDLENEVYKVSVAANVINILRLERKEFTGFLEETLVIERINNALKRVKIEYPHWSEKIAQIYPIEKRQRLFIQAYFPYLEQTFLNLLKNSYESIERDKVLNKKDGKGKISIELDVSKDGKNVVITFSDNGVGFILEDMEKLTQPTYTKKQATKKTNRGLGLFVCDKIVYLHNGIMYFSNNEEGGAIVKLYFPRYTPKSDLKQYTSDDQSKKTMEDTE